MKRDPVLSMSTALLLMTMVSGCDALAENLPKVVVLEYDQVLNFDNLTFDPRIKVTTPEGNLQGFSKIYAADGNVGGGGPVYGVFLTFIICKISNAEPKAENFQYDATKFYVVDDAGDRHYATNIEPYTLMYDNSLRVTPFWADQIEQALRNRTQVGDKETISAHQEVFPYFRFVIYVHVEYPNKIDMNMAPRLMYDSTYPHIMAPRNQPPKRVVDVKDDNLPTLCRPLAT